MIRPVGLLASAPRTRCTPPPRRRALSLAGALLLASSLVWASGVAAQTLPAGFQESTVFSGLTAPTAVAFAADGRVFVAEKSGLIKVFDSLSDPTPTIFADLRTKVYNFWDRGLLGLALHPNFPTAPYVYVLYTHDASIGGTAPRWGTAGTDSDPCPDPPGATGDGCVVSGRLSRLEAAGNVMVGAEQVFVEDWCQQYPSHSIGALAFGPDGALYASGGDGASFGFVDYGQDGNPRNPCGDPPVGVGGAQQPPSAEGGALRSEDLRTVADPVTLDGAILRLDPNTGQGMPDNFMASSSNPNERRIIAHGLRNPFRFTVRPGSGEVWIGDVGWNVWEEINRISNPTGPVLNFGWPCYEGSPRQGGYEAATLTMCSNLYAQATATAPFYAYDHGAKVVPGEPCPAGSSSISGLAFYGGGAYPATYNGALFFADYSRNCIWVMFNPPESSGGTVPGLVSAYGFNEGGGSTTADASDNGHIAAITGATWTTAGRFGSALSFDGVNDWVTVTDTPALDLTNGMTLMAWVYPTAHGNGVWRNVLIKERPGGEVYNLYSNVDTNAPTVYVVRAAAPGVPLDARGTTQLPLNTWTHLAATHDGTTLRLFVNGTQAGSQAVSGSLLTSDGDLRIGGNSIWGEFFQGRIDEVRVYNRSLSAAEIQTDMNTPITSTAPMTIVTFVVGAAGPVDLKIGPGGDLFYVSLDGTIRRIRYTAGNQPPTAVAQGAPPLSGPAPLTVTFNGASSSDPDAGDTLTYAWDLDGDGQFDDSTAVQPVRTYTVTGTYTVTLRVTDNHGASGTSSPILVTVGTPNTPPTATINTPASTLTWRASDLISFTGQGTDAEDQTLPSSALSWTLILHHCPSTCHTHPLGNFIGVTGNSFSAPDHEYPSHLELRLTVTDSGGLTGSASVLLYPQTVNLSLASNPSGLQIAFNSGSAVTPYSRTVIVGSANSVSAPSPQALGGTSYAFAAWSDGGAQTHNLTAGAEPATYTATYNASGPSGLLAAYSFNAGSGTTAADTSGNGHTGTISGATWTAAGKFGSALSFDGTNDWVTVADTPALDLTTGMTLMAWVLPTTTLGTQDILIKEGAGVDVYNLYARNWRGLPESNVFVGGTNRTAEGAALAANVWTHVAGTYDGTTLRLFINGVQVASQSVSGAMPASTGPLRIGGNSMWGEFFQGRIDEVRVYNRPLSAAEIQTDMNAAIP